MRIVSTLVMILLAIPAFSQINATTEAHDDLNIEAGTYFMDAFNCCIF